MVKKTIQRLLKKLLLAFVSLIFFPYLVTNTHSQNKTAYTTFLVSVTIASKCETNISDPKFVDDSFLSLKIVSDVTVVCNNDSKPIIKIISKNIKELNDNNFAFELKKNNGDKIGYTSDSLVQLVSNQTSRLDFEDESFTLKNNLPTKTKKIDLELPKNLIYKADASKNLKFQNSTIVFEISY